jgi:hypothetical protein
MTRHIAAVLVLLVLLVVLMSLQPKPNVIGHQCAGWYGYNPQTGRCDLGMPTSRP